MPKRSEKRVSQNLYPADDYVVVHERKMIQGGLEEIPHLVSAIFILLYFSLCLCFSIKQGLYKNY